MSSSDITNACTSSAKTSQMMPELRTDSNIDHLDVEKMDKANLRAGNSSSNFQNVAATRTEKSHFNPLPLQCLAAESLPETVKQEIEDITNSSLQEYNLKSTDHQKVSNS